MLFYVHRYLMLAADSLYEIHILLFWLCIWNTSNVLYLQVRYWFVIWNLYIILIVHYLIIKCFRYFLFTALLPTYHVGLIYYFDCAYLIIKCFKCFMFTALLPIYYMEFVYYFDCAYQIIKCFKCFLITGWNLYIILIAGI